MLGPRVNLAITPDQKLALVANALDEGKNVRKVGEAEVGALAEGVVFSPMASISMSETSWMATSPFSA